MYLLMAACFDELLKATSWWRGGFIEIIEGNMSTKSSMVPQSRQINGMKLFRSATMGQTIIAPTGGVLVCPDCGEMCAIVIDDG